MSQAKHTKIYEVNELPGQSIKLDWDVNNNPIYIGLAAPGASTADPVWQIRHLTFDGSNNPTSILFANGSLNFDQVWDLRATFGYS